MRIIFMGTAELARPILERLCAESPSSSLQFEVVAVVTQPDRPRGRELKLQPSPVKQSALQHKLPVLQPDRARNPGFADQLRALQPHLIVVAAYGQILPQTILDLPAHGCLNVHTSLLPKYRGAAPIQWAILNDEPKTGVTIMKMDAGLDTGDIVAQKQTPILPEDNAQTLHDRLARMGAELLVETIPGYVSGTIKPVPQPAEGASYARKITKEDGELTWDEPARAIWNKVRAFNPWPGSYTYLGEKQNRKMLKIWTAAIQVGLLGKPGEILAADKNGILVACSKDALRIIEIQREGGRRLPALDFLLGQSLRPGEILG
jgi:methionyl-tRNA formyltransferase